MCEYTYIHSFTYTHILCVCIYVYVCIYIYIYIFLYKVAIWNTIGYIESVGKTKKSLCFKQTFSGSQQN